MSTRKWNLWAPVLMIVLCPLSAFGEQTFSNPNPINIPVVGVAGTYPSPINVSSGPASISGSTVVTLVDVTHANVADLDILLVGPTGVAVMLISDAGASSVSHATLIFTASGRRLTFQDDITTGEWAPVDLEPGETLVAPAPAGPYSTSLFDFGGTNANGTWRLHIIDDSGTTAGGSIADGWSLTFAAASDSSSSAIGYQGRLVRDGSPLNGLVDLRFTLWDSNTASEVFHLHGGPVESHNVSVINGLFTTTIDFGFSSFAFDGARRFLEIEVRSPAVVGLFTTLSPRQAITPVPQAFAATRLVSNFADPTPMLELQGPDLVANKTTEFRAGLKVRTSPTELWQLGPQFSNGPDPSGLRFTFNEETSPTNTQGHAMVEFGTGSQSPTIRAPSGPAVALAANAGTLALGNDTVANMILDANDIQTRADETTAATLRLNRLGGGVAIGASSVTSGFRLEVAGAVRCTALTETSSAMFKDAVADLETGLAELRRLRPVQFQWNDRAPSEFHGRHDVGLLAEEVAAVLPQAVALDETCTPVGIDYSRVTVLAVQAIKQQQAQLEKLNAEIGQLRGERDGLARRLEAIEQRLGSTK